MGGHGSDENGVAEVREIITNFTAEPFEAKERLILINITQTYHPKTKDVYGPVRCCWRIDATKAKDCRLVLAHRRRIVLGAFRPTEWLPATKFNFPQLDKDAKRFGFVGEHADETTRNLYVGKRVPDRYRVKGAATPIRYVEPDK